LFSKSAETPPLDIPNLKEPFLTVFAKWMFSSDNKYVFNEKTGKEKKDVICNAFKKIRSNESPLFVN
jgi:hypothetical protein